MFRFFYYFSFKFVKTKNFNVCWMNWIYLKMSMLLSIYHLWDLEKRYAVYIYVRRPFKLWSSFIFNFSIFLDVIYEHWALFRIHLLKLKTTSTIFYFWKYTLKFNGKNEKLSMYLDWFIFTVKDFDMFVLLFCSIYLCTDLTKLIISITDFRQFSFRLMVNKI